MLPETHRADTGPDDCNESEATDLVTSQKQFKKRKKGRDNKSRPADSTTNLASD